MISRPDSPIQFVLPADWRVLGFALALTVVVTFLFGLVPALRASTVKPVSALKGAGEVHSRQRIMHAVIAAQVAFCFLVHFVAGLFVATFERLSQQPAGFSAENVLTLETVAKSNQPVQSWDQVTQHLKSMDGVESAALSGWAPMSGFGWRHDVWIGGRRSQQENPYVLGVSPGWFETMRVAMIDGRDFRREDSYPAVAIVTEAFAKRYFEGQNPVGETFEQMIDKRLVPTRIVGYVRDMRYQNMREAMKPVIFVPFYSTEDRGSLLAKDWGTFLVRTAGSDPLALASFLRQEIPRIRPEFRVSNIRTQTEIMLSHTVRERLLATLSFFFAVVALLLAGVGLYGVLNYSVLQRWREIGIRMALGAQPYDLARRVTAQVFGMLLAGALVGLGAGIASERYLKTLLFQVTARDFGVLVFPALTLLAVAVLAALPPVVRAVRVDPALALRSE